MPGGQKTAAAKMGWGFLWEISTFLWTELPTLFLKPTVMTPHRPCGCVIAVASLDVKPSPRFWFIISLAAKSKPVPPLFCSPVISAWCFSDGVLFLKIFAAAVLACPAGAVCLQEPPLQSVLCSLKWWGLNLAGWINSQAPSCYVVSSSTDQQEMLEILEGWRLGEIPGVFFLIPLGIWLTAFSF